MLHLNPRDSLQNPKNTEPSLWRTEGRIKNKKQSLFVHTPEGKLLGICLFEIKGDALFISDFFTSPLSLKIGRILTGGALSLAHKKKLAAIWFETEADPSQTSFFEGCGFKLVAFLHGAPGGRPTVPKNLWSLREVEGSLLQGH